MSRIFIMIGPPCSGKTTKAKEMTSYGSILRLNRDELRLMLKGTSKPYNDLVETTINTLTEYIVASLVSSGTDLLIDATHCRAKYITDIKLMVPPGSDVKFTYVICDVPFWLQRWRNFCRFLKTGTWIPRKVSIHMDRNFRTTLALIKTDHL